MARLKYNTITELQDDYQKGEFNFEDLLKTFETSIIDVSTEQKEEILKLSDEKRIKLIAKELNLQKQKIIKIS